MPVEKVKYTYLVVDDMNAAVAFYRDGLGLQTQVSGWRALVGIRRR